MHNDLKAAILAGDRDRITVVLRSESLASNEHSAIAEEELALHEASGAIGVRAIGWLGLAGGLLFAAMLLTNLIVGETYSTAGRVFQVLAAAFAALSGVIGMILCNALAELLERGRRHEWQNLSDRLAKKHPD